jgi:hypothetical protein
MENPDVALEPDQVAGMGNGLPRLAVHQPANEEIKEDKAADRHNLACCVQSNRKASGSAHITPTGAQSMTL